MKDEKQSRPIAGIVLWTIVALLVAGIAVFALMPRLKPPPVKTEEKVVAVRALKLEARSLPDTLLAHGRVEPLQDVVLGVEKGGRVVKLAADKGDMVRKGDVLLELDNRVWSDIKARAEIEVREAARNMGRWDGLKASGAVSDSDYESVKQRLDMARIGLREAEVQLSQCVILSPFDGLIEARPVDEGEHVAEGAPAFRVLDVSRLKVKASVSERDVPYVKLGQEVAFTVDSAPGAAMTGRVDFVSMAGNRDSNAFDIEMAVEKPDARLRPGMIVELSIRRRTWDDAIVVPLNAIVPQKGEHIAYVVDRNRAAARVLRIDRLLGSEAVIASGLAAGDMLVVDGQRGLQDGMLVEIRP